MMIDESTFRELYASSVMAFPKTTKRQHSTQPLVVESLSWTPFVGVKTLFVRAEVRNEARHYSPMLLFKNVNYSGEGVRLVASDGLEYSFDRPLLRECEILTRCDCPDFRYRFSYYNHLDRSLYGPKGKKYEGHTGRVANPLELPGLCKHLIKVVQSLRESGVVASSRASA